MPLVSAADVFCCSAGHCAPSVPPLCPPGDTWKAVVAARLMSDIEVIIVDIDQGVGVIRRRDNKHPLNSHWQQLGGGDPWKLINLLSNRHFREDKSSLIRLMPIDEMLRWIDEERVIDGMDVEANELLIPHVPAPAPAPGQSSVSRAIVPGSMPELHFQGNELFGSTCIVIVEALPRVFLDEMRLELSIWRKAQEDGFDPDYRLSRGHGRKVVDAF